MVLSGPTRTLRLLGLFAVLAVGVAGLTRAQEEDAAVALLATVEGAIGPATTAYVTDAIETAEARDAEVLVLRMNTPGGLVTSTRDIIAAILASEVPVIGYVAPAGAHAASAGTYILYATHVAAMAPGTNVGAATPVQMGGGSPLPGGGAEEEKPSDAGATEKETAEPPSPDALARKGMEDAVAFIRSLAEMRGRNAEWAEKAVREAASISAEEALDKRVIEAIADDVSQLLAKIDGMTVDAAGHKRQLKTAGLPVERIEPDLVTQALGVLANPNVAFILMLIGIYGLIFEFANPGSVGPGVIGAICLILGLYALNQLPLNYAGLGLIVLGIAFMTAEAFTPTMGVLGIGGLAAFVIGAAMLVDTEVPQFQIAWSVIAATAVTSGALLVFVLGYAWRAHRRPVATGAEHLRGSDAEVIDWQGETGHVWTEGERWHAEGTPGLEPGQTVRVTGVRGLTLEVAPVDGTHTKGDRS